MAVELLLTALAFLGSLIVAGAVRAVALYRGLLDIPNQRSLHRRPVPRGGGIGIVAAFLGVVGVAYLDGRVPFGLAAALLGGGAAVAILGFFDDVLGGLSNRVRMTVWFPAAAWAVYWVGGLPSLDLGAVAIPLGFAGSVLAVVGVVWITNLYNFMDGADGFAGTEAVVVGGAAAALLLAGGHADLALLAAALAAASAGFLVWNWPPARIFMGDVGSTFLGFVFAVLALATENSRALPATLWAILLAVFLVDATFTVARRVRHRERWYEAHRTHAYQYAITSGRSHRAATVGLLLLDSGLVVLAYAAWRWPLILPIAVAAAIVGLGLYWRRLTQYQSPENTAPATRPSTTGPAPP